MLYHPQSPYFAQFLQSGSRYNKRMDGAIGASTPAPSNASAAQAKAANMEKWAAIQLSEKTLIEPIAWRMTKNIVRFDKKTDCARKTQLIVKISQISESQTII